MGVLRISARSYAAGFALGFAIYYATGLVGAGLRPALGHASLIPVDILDMCGFHICVVVWLVSLVRPPKPVPIPPKLAMEHADLQLWGEQMQRMVN
jgi:hypothetical protein